MEVEEEVVEEEKKEEEQEEEHNQHRSSARSQQPPCLAALLRPLLSAARGAVPTVRERVILFGIKPARAVQGISIERHLESGVPVLPPILPIAILHQEIRLLTLLIHAVA